MKSKKNTERLPPGEGMISAETLKVLAPERIVEWSCPSCGKNSSISLPRKVISCTVLCAYCDCSIGLSGKGLKSRSIVHDPNREKSVWWTKKFDPEFES